MMSSSTLRIAIIGAGFAGVGAAVVLRKAGFTNLVVFERGHGVGGTWRDNTYPGAACDIPSHLYSFSFAPNPDWAHHFSCQPDILAYIEGVVERFGIRECIRLGTGVESADYDEKDRVWRVRTSDGACAIFDVLIPAVGQLSVPTIPQFAGLAQFQGASFHAARWDHSVQHAGRRVAVVGSAASAVQIVPELARSCAQLAVFQRTPNWIIPRGNRAFGAFTRRLFTRAPLLRRLLRGFIYLYQESFFGALKTGSRRNGLLTKYARWYLGSQIKDPALRAKLSPDYALGCKRLLVSDDYLPCFTRDNVTLVTEAIESFTTSGIRTVDGQERDFDLVVFATGFDVRNCLSPVAITGRGGVALQDAWAEGPNAYHGVAAPGFPNMFLLYGPNTNLGHNSIIFMLECQFDYIRQCLEHLVDKQVAAMEVRDDANARYNEDLQSRLGAMVWATGCGNWYGQSGKITANWSGSTTAFWRQMRRPRFEDFEVVKGS